MSISFGKSSSASRSRIAFLYSVRLSRRPAVVRPGSGDSLDVIQSALDRDDERVCGGAVGLSRRGGIVFVRTLRITFSHTA